MSDIDYEKSARLAVGSLLNKGEHTPAKAAVFIGQQISHAARATKDTRFAVVGSVKGALDAAHLAGLDLPETSVKVLESLANLSLMTRVSPEEVMTWVMEGIAGVAAMAGPEAREGIQAKIDEKFMGAGEIFNGFCQKALGKG